MSNPKFSKDGNYIYGFLDNKFEYYSQYLDEYGNRYNLSRYTRLSYKIDYETGKIIEERIVPFEYSDCTVLDFDEYGNVLLLFNDAPDRSIILYNIFENKHIAKISDYFSYSKSCTHIDARLDKPNNVIVLLLSYVDLESELSQNKGITEVQFRNFQGNLTGRQEFDFYLSNTVFSKSLNLISGKMFVPFIDSTKPSKPTIGYAYKDLKMLDLGRGAAISIDTSGCDLKYSPELLYMKFDENEKYLTLNAPAQNQTEAKKSIIYFYSLDSISENALKFNWMYVYKYSKDTSPSVFHFFNDSVIVTYENDWQKAGNHCFYSVNFKNKTYSRHSYSMPKKFYNDNMVLSPDKSSFVLTRDFLNKFNFDRTLRYNAIDFYADRQYAQANEQINFFANDHPHNSNFVWDFGDGRNATGRTASHIYSREGIYTVRLYYTDALKDSAVKYDYITIDGINSAETQYYDNFVLSVSPNPTSNTINIKYYLPEQANIKVSLINSLGCETALIDNEARNSGEHIESIIIQQDVPAGAYFIRFTAGSKTLTRKAIIIR